MLKGRARRTREAMPGDAKPSGGEHECGPTHDPESALVGRLHADCD